MPPLLALLTAWQIKPAPCSLGAGLLAAQLLAALKLPGPAAAHPATHLGFQIDLYSFMSHSLSPTNLTQSALKDSSLKKLNKLRITEVSNGGTLE